ncbi:MAG TPA: radical SAM protein [Candidatus Omnitrophota bacterium]|nr:radical SAM protein [Candidatus Omnitrophota bacterium]HPS19398.1 radical SAM protein [Candidatus Omnitrophota bacterium]
MSGEPIHLKNTALAITERCTLRCKLCFAYIPYHDNPQDITIDVLDTILRRYFSIVSSVDHFCVTGGEPLVHPHLCAILNMINGYSGQINKTIDIITNGTLDIKDDVLGFLKQNKDKTRVIISDYGKYSPKTKTLEERLRSSGIIVRIERYAADDPLYGGWIDCRDHSLKHFTQEEIDRQGKHCYFKNKRGYTIRKGELHNCGRSYWRMLKNIIPRNPEEYLNLLDMETPIEHQREILRKLHKKDSVTSCAYCWGANARSKRYKPAEQLPAKVNRWSIKYIRDRFFSKWLRTW